MNELIISMILIICLCFMPYISQLSEDVKRMNRTLDKLVKHLGVEIYSNIDDELRDIIKNGRKIKAIKRYREHTGLGLKESKEYIDNIDIK